jgi:hypothetical protein
VKKLSEVLDLSRTDRPDEWSMDDFSRMANLLEKQIIELEKDKTFLLTQRFMGNTIISNEQGLSDAIKAHNLEQQQRVISSLNSYLIKRANEIGECLPMYLVDHIKEFKGGEG